MIIRQENKDDYSTIYELVRTAFETAEMSDGHEQDFVNTLRDGDKYVPELALVAEMDNRIVGHIMLSKTCVENDGDKYEALLLGPVAVVLEYRNQKIGTKLIVTAMEKAKEMGFEAIFLAGNRAFYSRFGFVPAIRYGIKCALEIPEELIENIMVCELCPQALDGVTGIVDLGA